MMHQERTYRQLVHTGELFAFRVRVKETDLLVYAGKRLEQESRELVLQFRGHIEAFIKAHPDFATTLIPWPLRSPAPKIVVDMVKAGAQAGVGPMAAVAGAIAEHVGRGLLSCTDQVIVENGGDVFLKTESPATVGIYAGKSRLSLKIGLRVYSCHQPLAVCTSSGTVGHSLSLGKADAVAVICDSGSLADALATSIGNRITSKADITKAIDAAKQMGGVRGIAVIVGEKIGIWGDLEVVPLKAKKG
jgi:ApbE superfamily uncharacterized protein (UPF0280 family)